MNGKVFLLGAGPGDSGLLTQKAAELLSKAEVVVYDRLVGADILAMLPPGAEHINVGKHAGNHPVPQEQINELLLKKAQEGKQVVRLKGGDCFLFGRGGEELELLRRNGIPFEVVPGVPSPIAATAYAGIPVTHRDYCSSVHFITGHSRENGTLNLDFEALVRLKGTLVFLMSVATCGEIAAGLMANGMSPGMDCAVIENGTRPEQHKFITTVGELAEVIQDHRVISPALIVVGRVCCLSDQFDWFSALPLHGKSILVTSPVSSGSKLVKKLRELGAKVTASPAIHTRSLEFELPDFSRVSAAVFTSVTGVEAFFSFLFSRGKDARAFSGIPIAVVGKETEKTLKKFGILADLVPQNCNGAALGSAMVECGMVKSGDEVLLLRAKKATLELPAVLKDAGVLIQELAVYESCVSSLGDIYPNEYDWVTFTSASCVDSFRSACELSGFSAFSDVRALCIGPQTAKAAEKLGMKVSISEVTTIDAMADFLQVQGANLPGGMEETKE